MRILYVGSDFCSIKTLTSVLPKHIYGEGANIDIIVPRFAGIHEGESPLALRLIDANCQIDGRNEHIRIYEGRRDAHIRTFYLDSEALHVRPCVCNNDGIISSAVFAHGVCQFIEKIASRYDIVHCDGIGTALVPVMMRTAYAYIEKIASAKIVQSLAGINNKALIDMSYVNRLGLPAHLASSEGMEFYGKISLLKGAYLFADKLVFANDDVEKLIENNRGKDIGMEGVLFSCADKLAHVTVGIDKKALKAIDLASKPQLKSAFCKAHRLADDPRRPLIAFIGELNDRSGLDMVNDILDDIMDRKVELVICGDGNENYMNAVKDWTNEFRGSVCYISKRPQCADVREILAAADLCFVIPQRETIDTLALKARLFGCVPVAYASCVSKTAIDPVTNIKKIETNQNGFLFDQYNADDCFEVTMDALDLFTCKDAFKQLQKQTADNVACLCSTAKQLIEIYNALIG